MRRKTILLGQSSETADGWPTISDSLREYDEARIQNCKEDIDTLLVVAGLFSAVVTTFVVDFYHNLQTGDRSGASVRVNAIWFASLVCSISTASFGLLVKQWLREHIPVGHVSPIERTRIWRSRDEGFTRWHVFDIAAFLPLLLQVSILLFFIGLGDFLRNLDAVVGWVITCLTIVWLGLYVWTTIAPAFYANCPYLTPSALLRNGLNLARHGLYRVLHPKEYRMRRLALLGYPGDEDRVRRDPSQDSLTLAKTDAIFMDDGLIPSYKICLQSFSLDDTVWVVRQFSTNRVQQTVKTLSNLRDFGKGPWHHFSATGYATLVEIIMEALLRELDMSTREGRPLADTFLEALHFVIPEQQLVNTAQFKTLLHRTFDRDMASARAISGVFYATINPLLPSVPMLQRNIPEWETRDALVNVIEGFRRPQLPPGSTTYYDLDAVLYLLLFTSRASEDVLLQARDYLNDALLKMSQKVHESLDGHLPDPEYTKYCLRYCSTLESKIPGFSVWTNDLKKVLNGDVLVTVKSSS